MLLDSQFRSKSFQSRKTDSIKKSAPTKTNFLPLYPLFREREVHNLLIEDLAKILSTKSQSRMLGTAEKVKVCLIRILLGCQLTELTESL